MRRKSHLFYRALLELSKAGQERFLAREYTLVDTTTNQYSPTLVLTGYSLVGNSAEWVLQRPLLCGSAGCGFAQTMNYSDDVFWNLIAQENTGNYFNLGLSTATAVTMYDGKGGSVASLKSAESGQRGGTILIC